MNSKLLFIALASFFFQGVMTATVAPQVEDVKAVAKGNATEHVVNGTQAEATHTSNKTDVNVGIEYTTTVKTTLAPTVTTKTPTNTSTSTPTTVKPEPVPTASTTVKTSTSSTPTTVKPTTVSTVTTETPAKPSSTTPATVKPEPVPTATPETSVKAPSSTPATVIQKGSFDAPNFIGGIVLTLGLTAIGFVAYKFYKARKGEGNYRTL